MATPFGFGPQQYDPQAFNPNPNPWSSAAATGNQTRLNMQQQYGNQLGLNQQQFGFNTQLNQQGFGFQNQMLQEQLANQSQLAGLQAQTQRQGFQSQQDIARTQAEASKYPAQLQQQRFGQVFPYLSQALSGQLGGARGGLGGGGSPGGQPQISANPVYSPGQIQQQVNSQRAANDQGLGANMRNMQESLAGRGFGSNSPLAQALGVGMQQANLAQNTQLGTQTRLGAAQANAQQVLAGQGAQEQQYEARQKEQIQRAQIQQNYLSAALASLSGLV